MFYLYRYSFMCGMLRYVICHGKWFICHKSGNQFFGPTKPWLFKHFPGNWNHGRWFPWTWISLFAIRINNSLLQLCSKNVKNGAMKNVTICDKIFFFSNRVATKWADAEWRLPQIALFCGFYNTVSSSFSLFLDCDVMCIFLRRAENAFFFASKCK